MGQEDRQVPPTVAALALQQPDQPVEHGVLKSVASNLPAAGLALDDATARRRHVGYEPPFTDVKAKSAARRRRLRDLDGERDDLPRLIRDERARQPKPAHAQLLRPFFGQLDLQTQLLDLPVVGRPLVGRRFVARLHQLLPLLAQDSRGRAKQRSTQRVSLGDELILVDVGHRLSQELLQLPIASLGLGATSALLLHAQVGHLLSRSSVQRKPSHRRHPDELGVVGVWIDTGPRCAGDHVQPRLTQR